MATVGHLISLLVFLLAVDFLASDAWPVASGPAELAAPNQGNIAISDSRLAGVSPLSVRNSAFENSRGEPQIATSAVVASTSQADATVPRQSSSQSNNESPSLLYSRDSNYNKPISDSNIVVEQSVRPNRDSPLLANPSKQNSSESRADKTASLETDKLTEGSGMGPMHKSQGKEAKSKLDDTEESDDDDEDYDETLDTGSGHGNLNNKPSSLLPSNTAVGSFPSELKERPQQSDFYKPFRPPPQPASPSPVATVDNQQRRPNSHAPETVSSPVAAREAPAQVSFVAKNVTASFAVTTPAPPRMSSVNMATLATPALSRSETAVAQNRTKSEPDYEDEEESDDEDDGETSAFEDNDTSEADAARQPMLSTLPNSNSTLHGPAGPALRPLDRVDHLSGPSGFERPQNGSSPLSVKPGTLFTRPDNIPPSLPPNVLARPQTPPSVRPTPSSASPSSVGDHGDEEEDEEVEEDDEEDEEEDEEEEDDEAAANDDMDGDDRSYPVNITRPILGSAGDNRPHRPSISPPKPAATMQNHAPREQTTTTSAPTPSQYNKRPTPSGPANQAPAASSSQPPRLAAPVNHEANREPHHVTTVMPTRMPATNITPPTSKLTVPIVLSQPPSAGTNFVPTIHPPSYKPPASILNAATSVTTTTSQQPQPPILVPTIRGQQQTTSLVNPQPATTTTGTPQDRPRSHFTTLDPRPPPTMQFAPPPTNRGGGVDVGQTNRALRDNNVVAADDTLTKQIYDKAVEVYHEADKTVRAAWEAVWPPNMNFDSASMEPLLTQPLFFMLALGGAIICLVLLMMLVVYIISYQIQPKVDDDISIY